MPKEDPYKVLGIQQRDRNNLEAIKKAYRKKAKDSHPDKNPNMDPEKATANFRRILDAYEFLSNPRNKKLYDHNLAKKNRGGTNTKQRMTYTTKGKQQKMSFQHYSFNQKTDGSYSQQNQRQQNQQYYKQHNKRTQILRDAKVAQERVLKLSTLEQLQSTLLDRNQRFKKHFFCVFVAGKKMEQFVDKDLLFPYPFGPNGRNDMNWESILQAAKVRYNSPTPLTQAFRVPSNQRAANKPYIVFAKKGDLLHQFKVYRPKAWTLSKPYDSKLEQWVLEQLTTPVTIVNYHHAPIHIFINDDVDGLQSMGKPIPPGHDTTIQALLGDRVLAFDANTDHFPGSAGWKPMLLNNEPIRQAATLSNVLITDSPQHVMEIGVGYGNTRRCYDLSLQCPAWATEPKRGQQLPNCQAHLDFAHTICPYSCGICVESSFNGVYYGLFYLPLYKVPTPVLRGILSTLRSSANFAKTFLHDLDHLFHMRRNVTVSFILAGFLAGIQIVILGQMMTTTTRTRSSSHPPAWESFGLVLLLAICMFGWGLWITQAPPHQVPFALRGFHKDLTHMVRNSMDVVYGLVFLGFVSLVLSKKLVQRRPRPGPRRSNRFVFLLTLVVLSTLLIVGTSHALHNDLLVSGKRNHRYVRWTSIWQLRKNVALCIFVWGCLLGASTMGLGRLILQVSRQYVGLSILNGSLLCFGMGLALKDQYFFKDLDHVLTMRMSAAIPCAVLGMMWGVGLAHFLSSYQVRLKVD